MFILKRQIASVPISNATESLRTTVDLSKRGLDDDDFVFLEERWDEIRWSLGWFWGSRRYPWQKLTSCSGFKQLDALVQDYLKASPKIDLEQTNEGLEDDFPLQAGDFQIPCWFSRVYIPAPCLCWFFATCCFLSFGHITGMAPKIWLCRDTWISQWKMLSIYRREKNHDGFQEYSYFILFLVFLVSFLGLICKKETYQLLRLGRFDWGHRFEHLLELHVKGWHSQVDAAYQGSAVWWWRQWKKYEKILYWLVKGVLLSRAHYTKHKCAWVCLFEDAPLEP